MTIKSLFEYIKTTKDNPYSDTTLLMWVNELEAEIQLNIFLLNVEDVIEHTATTEGVVADAAHTIIYRLYLSAMIDFTRKEFASYQNTYEVFKQEMNNYSAWYADRYHPADGRAEVSGYYISAYALAVKHGFSGTEEAWIAAVEAARLSASASAASALASAEAAALSESNVAVNTQAALTAKEAAETARNAADAARDSAIIAKNAALVAQEEAEAAETAAELSASNAATHESGANTAKTGAETAQAAAVSAKNAALAAQGAAESAKTAAETAKGLAETAKTAAETAKTDAVNAKSLAETAKTAAQNAQSLAETARNAAQGAQTAAESAKTSAESARDAAQGYASSAHTDATAATTAKNEAVTAKNAAETAKGLAETAKSGADTAKAGAELAKTSAETARTGAESARDTAISAKDNAVTAKNAAQSAQSAAELAKTNAETAKTNAETAESNAEGFAENAEAWADGTINGVPVTSGNPAYQNNSKYYKEQAAAIVGGDYPTKSEAQGYATTAKNEAITAAATDATTKANASAAASIPKSLATAASQFLVSSAVGAWAVKTIAETKTLLGLGSAAYTNSTAYATAAQGTKADGAIQSSLGTASDQVLVSTGAGAWAVKTLAQVKTWLGLGSAAYLNTGTTTGSVATGDHTHTASAVTDFAATVRATVLTGISTATNAVIAAADTVIIALGKLQAQITANLTTLTNHTGNTLNPHSTTAAQVGASTRTSGTGTLAVASWVGSAAPYSYEFAIAGLLAADTPHVDRVTGTDAAAAALINTAWGLIAGYAVKPQTSAGKITFYASAKPTVAIPIMYEVVRT